MKKEYDVIVIGGGPAGIISAITTRKYNPKKKILLIKDVGDGVIPCGIPYMFATLKNPEENSVNDMPLEKNNIDLKIDKVVEINRNEMKILTKDKTYFKYKKLILAMGSNPTIPSIEGIEKKGIYPIYKKMSYLKNLKNVIQKSKNIIIIGGGFIGIEFADELSKLKNTNISLIELLPEILSNSFDLEFSKEIKHKLLKKRIKIYNNIKVKKINGKDKVKSILLSNGKLIPADIIILGIGSNPNISLAKNSGIKTSNYGISVNKYLQTSDKNIFAIGDCAEKKDFFTKQKQSIMLASIATTEARIVGNNIFNDKPKKNNGTLASYSTKIRELAIGSTGINEKTAIKKGFEIIIGTAESTDKHPKKLPNTSLVKVKLIFSKKTKILLGGQISGGDSIGEMINIISTAIQKKFTINELESLQIATHPKLTSAPTTYPIITAAQNALQQIK